MSIENYAEFVLTPNVSTVKESGNFSDEIAAAGRCINLCMRYIGLEQILVLVLDWIRKDFVAC